MIRNNKHPTSICEPLIHSTIEKLHVPHRSSEAEEVPKNLLSLQYRVRVTMDYVRALDKLQSLKVPVDKSFKSRVLCKLLCPRCQACYVGRTVQHLLKRFKQHCQLSQTFGKHIRLGGTSPVFGDKKDVSILYITRSIPCLEALEAFWIREIRPVIDLKDEYRRKELNIKF